MQTLQETQDFIHRLKGALMYKGGTGAISSEVIQFIDTCFRNDIVLLAKLKEKK